MAARWSKDLPSCKSGRENTATMARKRAVNANLFKVDHEMVEKKEETILMPAVNTDFGQLTRVYQL